MKKNELKTAVNIVWPNRKTVFVSITKALKGQDHTVTRATSLPDIARGWWYVDDTKIRQCELLAAVKKGIVVQIWAIDRNFGWRPMAMNTIPTRAIRPIDIDSRRKYCQLLGSCEDVPQMGSNVNIKIRMYGPVRYNF